MRRGQEFKLEKEIGPTDAMEVGLTQFDNLSVIQNLTDPLKHLIPNLDLPRHLIRIPQHRPQPGVQPALPIPPHLALLRAPHRLQALRAHARLAQQRRVVHPLERGAVQRAHPAHGQLHDVGGQRAVGADRAKEAHETARERRRVQHRAVELRVLAAARLEQPQGEGLVLRVGEVGFGGDVGEPHSRCLFFFCCMFFKRFVQVPGTGREEVVSQC